MTLAEKFFTRGWARFDPDRRLQRWVEAARPIAARIAADPEARQQWLRHGETWFAGVNVLPNGPDGGIGGAELDGPALDFVRGTLGLGGFEWDRAQLSICLPGYPRHGPEETEAAFRFRRDRDAAHVDGLVREPPARRRRLGETHGFVLGLPLDDTPPGASPMVVYEGSHEIMRAAFRARLSGLAPDEWAGEDITDAYAEARRVAFAECRRVTVSAPAGGAYLVHRLALHGVAPWTAPPGPPRAVVYFRPDPWPGRPPGWWLEDP